MKNNLFALLALVIIATINGCGISEKALMLERERQPENAVCEHCNHLAEKEREEVRKGVEGKYKTLRVLSVDDKTSNGYVIVSVIKKDAKTKYEGIKIHVSYNCNSGDFIAPYSIEEMFKRNFEHGTEIAGNISEKKIFLVRNDNDFYAYFKVIEGKNGTKKIEQMNFKLQKENAKGKKSTVGYANSFLEAENMMDGKAEATAFAENPKNGKNCILYENKLGVLIEPDNKIAMK